MKSRPEIKKKRRKKRYLLRLFFIIAFGTGLYFFLNSSIFQVNLIQVEGNNHYGDKEVISLSRYEADKELNIFNLDRKNRIILMEKDPYIKSAKIKRKLPNTIIINLIERTEDAAVPYGESYVLISLDGMVLKRVDIEPEVPLLMGMTIIQMYPGISLEVEETTVLENTLTLLKTMLEYNLYFKKIDISNLSIRASIYDNLVCEGRPENIMAAMESGKLELVLKDLMDRGIQYGTIHLGGRAYVSFSPVLEGSPVN